MCLDFCPGHEQYGVETFNYVLHFFKVKNKETNHIAVLFLIRAVVSKLIENELSFLFLIICCVVIRLCGTETLAPCAYCAINVWCANDAGFSIWKREDADKKSGPETAEYIRGNLQVYSFLLDSS